MKIILFSGDGQGAGKTTASKILCQDTISFASAIRQELTYKYPAYNWYNKTQSYKDTTIIKEWPVKATMRQVLYEYGQVPCKQNPSYWAEKVVDYLKNRHFIADGVSILGIDDCRKMCEKETMLKAFPGKIYHIHVDNPDAVREPEFENEQLRATADYIIRWKK